MFSSIPISSILVFVQHCIVPQKRNRWWPLATKRRSNGSMDTRQCNQERRRLPGIDPHLFDGYPAPRVRDDFALSARGVGPVKLVSGFCAEILYAAGSHVNGHDLLT